MLWVLDFILWPRVTRTLTTDKKPAVLPLTRAPGSGSLKESQGARAETATFSTLNRETLCSRADFFDARRMSFGRRPGSDGRACAAVNNLGVDAAYRDLGDRAPGASHSATPAPRPAPSRRLPPAIVSPCPTWTRSFVLVAAQDGFTDEPAGSSLQPAASDQDPGC